MEKSRIPRRFYGGKPKRLLLPVQRIHSCSCCGVHYGGAPCPGQKKRVDHRSPEFCTTRCEGLYEAWGLS